MGHTKRSSCLSFTRLRHELACERHLTTNMNHTLVTVEVQTKECINIGQWYIADFGWEKLCEGYPPYEADPTQCYTLHVSCWYGISHTMGKH